MSIFFSLKVVQSQEKKSFRNLEVVELSACNSLLWPGMLCFQQMKPFEWGSAVVGARGGGRPIHTSSMYKIWSRLPTKGAQLRDHKQEHDSPARQFPAWPSRKPLRYQKCMSKWSNCNILFVLLLFSTSVHETDVSVKILSTLFPVSSQRSKTFRAWTKASSRSHSEERQLDLQSLAVEGFARFSLIWWLVSLPNPRIDENMLRDVQKHTRIFKRTNTKHPKKSARNTSGSQPIIRLTVLRLGITLSNAGTKLKKIRNPYFARTDTENSDFRTVLGGFVPRCSVSRETVKRE